MKTILFHRHIKILKNKILVFLLPKKKKRRRKNRWVWKIHFMCINRGYKGSIHAPWFWVFLLSIIPNFKNMFNMIKLNIFESYKICKKITIFLFSLIYTKIVSNMMVRWMCGVSLKNKKCSLDLNSLLRIQCVSDVVKHGRFWWLGPKSEDDWMLVCRSGGGGYLSRDRSGGGGYLG